MARTLLAILRWVRSARRARGAVAALFFANGALFANLVPRFPELKADLDLSNAAFGTAMAGYGVGALIAGLLAGLLVSRFGSVVVAPASTLGIAANLVLVGVAPSYATLAAALLAAGALDSIADIAVNAHGLRVERRYQRSILNSLHGLWSVGAVVGGAMGAAAAGRDVPLPTHLAIAAALFAALAIGVSRLLLPGRDDAELTPKTGRLPRLGLARTVLALGVIAAMAQVMEEATATWGAVYLREELGAAAAVSGLGFIALQSTQTVGRLLGDRVVERFCDRAVARAGAGLAGTAMAAALAAPATATTILAFGLVGLGIGTLIPAGLRAADGLPGLPRGVGLSLVGTVIRVAVLVSPALIGVTADATSLRAALFAMPLAAAVVLVLSPVLPGRR
jgi:MFS family permease